MMKSISYFLFLAIVLSCASNKENQHIKINGAKLRHGLWIEEYDTDGGKLLAKGRYDKGEKVGVWKTSFKGRKYQKDVIRNGIIKTKVYHQNGRLMEKGQSRTDISSHERHWYYFGDWKYYDENGKLKFIRKYAEGKKIDSINVAE